MTFCFLETMWFLCILFGIIAAGTAQDYEYQVRPQIIGDRYEKLDKLLLHYQV